MNALRPLACLGALCCALTPAARAASGGIDSFSASATQVHAGGTVDFSVAFSLGTTSWSGGGSNPVEPAPVEGYQEWNVNWYSWEYETLRSVWLQAGSKGFSASPTLSAGESYAGNWSFSVTFATPGTYSFDLTGGWQSDIRSGYSNESASRSCYLIDPNAGSNLACDAWSWSYSDGKDNYSSDGSFSGHSISIEVLAPTVPEPSTWLLMLAGAGGLLARARRRA